MLSETILHSIFRNAESQPDKLALCEGRKSITYSEYRRAIRRTAAALVENGIQKGDRVMLIARQTIDYLTVFSALQYMGALPIPLEKSASDERIREIGKSLDAEIIIADREIVPLKTIDSKKLMRRKDVCEEAERSLPKGDDLSMLLYTTGTTGSSKGVVMKHGNDSAIAENVAVGTEMKADNVEVLPMPLNHSFAIRRYEANMFNGSTVCLLDGLVFIGSLWKMMEKYHVTSLALAPAGLKMMIELSGERLVQYSEQLDYIQLGSAPLMETEKQWLKTHLPSIRMYNIYGSSEAGCATILNFNSDDDIVGCIGRPTVNSLIRFTDEEGKILEKTDRDHTGLLAWGGKIVADGYYNAPELTAKTFKNGFVQTNDIAYIDEKGRCILCGRADDVINVGGSKVAPLEVEECALQYTGIKECACMPIADSITGEAPVLLVVENAGYDKSELEEILNRTLEFYKLPKKIVSVAELPKTFNGKLLRREIKKRLNEWIKE